MSLADTGRDTPDVTSIVCPKKKRFEIGRKQNVEPKFMCLFWTKN